MATGLGTIVKTTVDEALEDGVAVLTGQAAAADGQAMPEPQFKTGLATLPNVLPRRALGLIAPLLVQPGTWAVVHLPGGEQRVYEPGSYALWNIGPGAILVQWVDARRQAVPVGPVEGWSVDKWRVRLWVVVDVQVEDPVQLAAHRDPLGALVAAAHSSALRYMEQHTHAALTGCEGDQGGMEAPALTVAQRLRDDPALHGLRIISVRVVERQGDERQIEAATAATVAAAQIDEEQRVAAARHRARLHELEAQAEVTEREHVLRMAATAAGAREQLLAKQSEVQREALSARLDIALAQIRAHVAEIAHDEQCWQAEQARLHGEWERLQQQQLDVHHTDQQVRLLETQHTMIRGESEVALAAEERRNTHELALAEMQQRLAEQRAAQAQAIAERRERHEQTLLELHLRHDHLVAEQMQQLEHWRTQQVQISVQQQRQQDRQIAVIAGAAQIAAAAAGQAPDGMVDQDERREIAEAGLRTLQTLAE